jgi:hypothetical protein
MTGQTLREFIELASTMAEKLFRKYGCLAPIWHYIDRNGEHHVMPAPDYDKNMSAAIMRALFELHGATRCVFIDEAWILDHKGEPDLDKLLRIAGAQEVKDHPARQEVIMLSAEDQIEGQLMARRVIERPPDSKPRLGPLIIDSPEGRMEGRFIGMLPRQPGKMQ